MIRPRVRLFVATLAVCALQGVASGADTIVSGFVFDDRNGDGVRQSGENGIANVAVSNQIDVVATGADGSYRLSGRGTGVVFVSVPRGKAAPTGFWKPVPVSDAASIDFALAPTADPDDFTFVHASDTHIHEESLPRMKAFLGLLDSRKPAFAVVTGDLIRDALRVDEATAARLYDLYVREVKTSATPIWSDPGNHENFGIERHHSLVAKTHPLFGKGMYRKHLGPNYYSFNRGRIHFIALDTVDIEDLWYYGHVDKAQLDWLVKDLALLPKGTTVVTFNHIPFLSSRTSATGYTDTGTAPSLIRINDRMQYRHIVSNATDLFRALKDYNFTLSLSGHNHAFERLLLSPLPGATRFHLAAAVIGPTNDVVPSPSGVTLYRVRGDVIDEGEFVAIDPAAVR